LPGYQFLCSCWLSVLFELRKHKLNQLKEIFVKIFHNAVPIYISYHL